jgi:transposase-like protein
MEVIMGQDELWLNFPKTLAEFDKRFPDEEACRAYLIELRWGGTVRCGRCEGDETWELQNGRFECKRCGHQTSVTAGTLFHRTHKPLRLWFRAMWEMAARKGGINACELQRLMGFGSYGTAWNWLHKLRRAMANRSCQRLDGFVVVDESYLGGKGHVRGRGTEKALVLVAAEDGGGRIRIEPAGDASADSIGPFVNRNIATQAHVTTDGWSGYSPDAVGGRPHDAKAKVDWSSKDPFHMCHLVAALLKRWWIGTYHGSMSAKHMPLYFEEFTFRFNRRKTNGIGRITSRLLELAIASKPITEAELLAQPIAA